MKPLRYVEISHRNMSTRIRVGNGSYCNSGSTCGDVCIVIKKVGADKCNCGCDYRDNPCGCNPVPTNLCCEPVAEVCATEIDDDGYAVFHWPRELLGFTQGWYEGFVYNGCSQCGKFPVRIGPRCNVLEVETVIIGPDSKCAVPCEEPCVDDACHPKYSSKSNNTTVYKPNYEVYQWL